MRKIIDLYSKEKSNNNQVLINLSRLQNIIDTRPTLELLVEALDKWEGDTNLTFRNRLPHTIIGFGILCAISWCFIGYELTEGWFKLGMTPYLLIIIFGWLSRKDYALITELIDQMEFRIIDFKYEMSIDEPVKNWEDFNWMEQFPLFAKGNYENKITKTANTELYIDGHTFPLTLYKYHYVNESESKDDKGNKTVSYTHYDVWGIVLFDVPLTGIAVSLGNYFKDKIYPLSWSTSDISFNKRHKISGTTEMGLAKCFTPRNVLALEQAFYSFGGGIICHADQPVMVWEFKVDIFEREEQYIQVTDIQTFKQKVIAVKLANYELLKTQMTKFIDNLVSQKIQ